MESEWPFEPSQFPKNLSTPFPDDNEINEILSTVLAIKRPGNNNTLNNPSSPSPLSLSNKLFIQTFIIIAKSSSTSNSNINSGNTHNHPRINLKVGITLSDTLITYKAFEYFHSTGRLQANQIYDLIRLNLFILNSNNTNINNNAVKSLSYLISLILTNKLNVDKNNNEKELKLEFFDKNFWAEKFFCLFGEEKNFHFSPIFFLSIFKIILFFYNHSILSGPITIKHFNNYFYFPKLLNHWCSLNLKVYTCEELDRLNELLSLLLQLKNGNSSLTSSQSNGSSLVSGLQSLYENPEENKMFPVLLFKIFESRLSARPASSFSHLTSLLTLAHKNNLIFSPSQTLFFLSAASTHPFDPFPYSTLLPIISNSFHSLIVNKNNKNTNNNDGIYYEDPLMNNPLTAHQWLFALLTTVPPAALSHSDILHPFLASLPSNIFESLVAVIDSLFDLEPVLNIAPTMKSKGSRFDKLNFKIIKNDNPSLEKVKGDISLYPTLSTETMCSLLSALSRLPFESHAKLLAESMSTIITWCMLVDEELENNQNSTRASFSSLSSPTSSISSIDNLWCPVSNLFQVLLSSSGHEPRRLGVITESLAEFGFPFDISECVHSYQHSHDAIAIIFSKLLKDIRTSHLARDSLQRVVEAYAAFPAEEREILIDFLLPMAIRIAEQINEEFNESALGGDNYDDNNRNQEMHHSAVLDVMHVIMHIKAYVPQSSKLTEMMDKIQNIWPKKDLNNSDSEEDSDDDDDDEDEEDAHNNNNDMGTSRGV